MKVINNIYIIINSYIYQLNKYKFNVGIRFTSDLYWTYCIVNTYLLVK